MSEALVTPVQFSQLFPRLSYREREDYLVALIPALYEFLVFTSERIAAFLAQCGHESMGLYFWKEIWGPTDAQLMYEPPHPTARWLGNTQHGDGKLFCGRGPLQLTGRGNYREAGLALGLPLEEHPEMVEEPRVGFRTSARFWRTRGCNELADHREFVEITRRINGGLNGLDDRFRWWRRACIALDLELPVPLEV